MRKAKIIMTIILIVSFVLENPSLPVRALNLGDIFDDTTFEHSLVAADGGGTITDTYYQVGHEGQTSTETFTLATNVDFTIKSNASGTILYSMDGITSSSVPFYFALDVDTPWKPSIVQLNSDKTLSQLGATDILNSTFPPDQATYIRSYLESLNSSLSDIKGITEGTVALTDNTINCPDIQIQNATKKVAYEDLQSGQSFKSADEKTRYDAKRPPADAYLQLFWKPPGSPIFVSEPLQKVKIKEKNVGGQLIDYFEFNRDQKLRAGTYDFVTIWAVKSVDVGNTTILQFDNLQTYGNFMTEMMRIKTPTTFWGIVQSMFVPSIVTLIKAEADKADLNYKIYGIDSSFTVAADGTMTPSTCPDLTAIRQQSLDYTDAGGDNTTCGSISGNAIFQWAFCSMLMGIKSLADWVQSKAMAIFTTMTGISTVSTSTGNTTSNTASP